MRVCWCTKKHGEGKVLKEFVALSLCQFVSFPTGQHNQGMKTSIHVKDRKLHLFSLLYFPYIYLFTDYKTSIFSTFSTCRQMLDIRNDIPSQIAFQDARTRQEVMLTVTSGRNIAPGIHGSHNIARRHVVSAEANCRERLLVE